jgi:hypothetical protein
MYDIIFGTTSKKLQKTILDIRKHARHYIYRGQRILAMSNEVSNTGGTRSLDKELDLFAEPIKSLLHLYMSTPAPDTIAKYESSSSSATIEEVLFKAMHHLRTCSSTFKAFSCTYTKMMSSMRTFPTSVSAFGISNY